MQLSDRTRPYPACLRLGSILSTANNEEEEEEDGDDDYKNNRYNQEKSEIKP